MSVTTNPSELSQSELDEFEQRQNDIMAKLTDLQNMELAMYSELDTMISNGGSAAAKQALFQRIQTISDTRMDMYRDLMDNYAIIRQSVGQTRGNLVDQLTLIDNVQQQLDSLRKQAGDLNINTSGKKRMIEINTYYGQKYMAQKELMQIVILTCVPLLLLALLAKFGTLGREIASMIGTVVLVVGGYYIVRKIFDIKRRNNQVFDEYDWGKAPPSDNSAMDISSAGLVDDGSMDLTMGGCFGQQCCSSGMVYNKKLSKCETPSSAPAAATA